MGQNAVKQGFASRRPESFNSLAPRVQTFEIGSGRAVSAESIPVKQSAIRSSSANAKQEIKGIMKQIKRPEILTDNPYMLSPPPQASTISQSSKPQAPPTKPLKPILKKHRKPSIEVQIQKNNQLSGGFNSQISPPLQTNTPSSFVVPNKPQQTVFQNKFMPQPSIQANIKNPMSMSPRPHPQIRVLSPRPQLTPQRIEKQKPTIPDVPLIKSVVNEPYFPMTLTGVDATATHQNQGQLSLLSFIDQPVKSQQFDPSRYKVRTMWGKRI